MRSRTDSPTGWCIPRRTRSRCLSRVSATMAPDGCIVLPVLSNIYVDTLDQYIDRPCPHARTARRRRVGKTLRKQMKTMPSRDRQRNGASPTWTYRARHQPKGHGTGGVMPAVTQTTADEIKGPIRLCLRGDDSEDAYSLVDEVIPPGYGPPLHVHPSFAEGV